MTVHSQTATDSAALPPIVLMVADDPDTREMYSVVFELSGMWVATASTPADAVGSVAELKPDAVVTDVEFDGAPGGLELIDAIKQNPSTVHVPVVLLGGRLPGPKAESGRAQADLFLLKPVLPDELVACVSKLVERSRELRLRSQRVTNRAADLMQRSNATLAQAHEVQAHVAHLLRRCPCCAQPLNWVETGRIDGAEYDYYHRCGRGCGLYCYDRAARRWVKLAG